MPPIDRAVLPHEIQPTPSTVRPLGRVAFESGGGARFSWSGSGVEVRFSGTALAMDAEDGGETYYRVTLDGRPLDEKLRLPAERSVVLLAAGLSPGPHVLRVVRLNEPLVSTTQLHALLVGKEARFLPPDLGDRPRIEVIGDSITAGFGNEGADEDCGFSPATQSADRTYAAFVAERFGAELTTLAWSGKGVFSNRGDEEDRRTMSELWQRTLPDEGLRYDFSGPPPRVVVINLGTNDLVPNTEDWSPFASAAQLLLDDVRRAYPMANIVVTVGPLLSDQVRSARPAAQSQGALGLARSAWRRAVESRAAAGDERVHFLEFAPVRPASEGWGCQYHPSLQTHRRMAGELLAALERSRVFSLETPSQP